MGDIKEFLELAGRKQWVLLTDEILSQGIEATSVLYIDMCPEIKDELKVGHFPQFHHPEYELNISKNIISRAVVELVLITAYATVPTCDGPYFKLSSFKKFTDFVDLPFIDVVEDFILEEHRETKKKRWCYKQREERSRGSIDERFRNRTDFNCCNLPYDSDSE